MKTPNRTGLISGFVLGALFSSVCILHFCVNPARRDVADVYQMDVHRYIRSAELILEGDTNRARRMLEGAMLATADGIMRAFPDHPLAEYHLYRINNYFTEHNIAVTNKYAVMMAELPTAYPTNYEPFFYYQTRRSYADPLLSRERQRIHLHE